MDVVGDSVRIDDGVSAVEGQDVAIDCERGAELLGFGKVREECGQQ